MNKMSPFTQRQTDYLLKCKTSWFNVAEGGKRGGKNVLNTLAFCIGLETHPDRLHLVAGVSIAAAKLNILDCDGYGLLNYFNGRCREGKFKNRDALYIQTKVGEKVILISGGAKDGDEKLIKGNTYGSAYITEANECHPKFIQEVFDRTLSSSDRKIYHDLNPKAPKHWYYTDILEFHERQQLLNNEYGYNFGHFTIADNMSISDNRLQTILKTYEKGSIWYQRDIQGKRMSAEGVIYDMFNHEKHVINQLSETDCLSGTRYVSVDYGTENPCCFLMWERSVLGIWVCTKEYYYSGREQKKQKTDSEYANDLDGWIGKKCPIIIDPSADSFKVELRRRGYTVINADNSVIDGIRLVGSFLAAEKLLFYKCCKNTIGEFELYSWDAKAAENGDDVPIKANDHCMDAVRYFVYTILNPGNKVKIQNKARLGLR